MIRVRVNQEIPIISTSKLLFRFFEQGKKKPTLVQIFSFAWISCTTGLKDVKGWYYVAGFSHPDDRLDSVPEYKFVATSLFYCWAARVPKKCWQPRNSLFSSLIFAVCASAYWFFTSQRCSEIAGIYTVSSFEFGSSLESSRKVEEKGIKNLPLLGVSQWASESIYFCFFLYPHLMNEYLVDLCEYTSDTKCCVKWAVNYSNFNEERGKGSDLEPDGPTPVKIPFETWVYFCHISSSGKINWNLFMNPCAKIEHWYLIS